MTWVPGKGLDIPTQWGLFTIKPGGFAMLLLAYVWAFHITPIVRGAMAGEQGAKYFTWACHGVTLFILWGVAKPLITAATGIS